MALGVSVILQSIERFIQPSRLESPVLVMSVGAAGIGSNILMLLVLGGKRSRSLYCRRAMSLTIQKVTRTPDIPTGIIIHKEMEPMSPGNDMALTD
jgi:zinc transporter 1